TLAHLANTTEKEDQAIEHWTTSAIDKSNKIHLIAAVLIPLLFFISLAAMIFDWHHLATRLTMFFFSINLLCAGLMSQNILIEISKIEQVVNSLQQYTKMIQVFESTQYQSVGIKVLQTQLKKQDESTTSIVNELANLFEKLNTVANLFIFIAFN